MILCARKDLGQAEGHQTNSHDSNSEGMQLFAYNWKLPAYSGASFLTVVFGNLFWLQWELSYLQLELSYLQLKPFCLQWENASNKHFNEL